MTGDKQFPYATFISNNRRWDDVVFREDDVIISTAAKCGTTWMQMQVALLLFRTPDLPAPLAQLSPWVDMNTRPVDEMLSGIEAQTHRRFFKTHTPLGGLPWDERVTYLHVARDPRDVAMSWDNHLANIDMDRLIEARAAAVGLDDLAELGFDSADAPVPLETEAARFWQWMEGDGTSMSSLEQLVFHSETFWDARDRPNVHLFHYAVMRADAAGEMARVAAALGVDPPTEELLAASDFRAMKAKSDVLVPNSDTPFWNSSIQFFDKARAGDWRALIGDEGARYDAALHGATGDEALIAWLHQGS